MNPRLDCSGSLLNNRENNWFFKYRPPGGLLEGCPLSLEPRLQREAVAGPTRFLITDREVKGECQRHLPLSSGYSPGSFWHILLSSHGHRSTQLFPVVGPPMWGRRYTYSSSLIMFGSLPHGCYNSQDSSVLDVRGWRSLFQ